jgi:hypothetical protein
MEMEEVVEEDMQIDRSSLQLPHGRPTKTNLWGAVMVVEVREMGCLVDLRLEGGRVMGLGECDIE